MRIDLWNEVSSNGQRPYIETALLPCPSGPRPLIVVCPGGGYTHFGRYEGLPVAGRFNELGFHAVVLEYRIKPTKFPEPVQDLLRAIRIVRMNAETGDEFDVTQFACSLGKRIEQDGWDAGTALDDDRVAGPYMAHRLSGTNVFRAILWGHRGRIGNNLR